MKTGSAIKTKWEGDIRLKGRPPTYSSTDQFIEIFKLLQQNSAVNTDVGGRHRTGGSPSHLLFYQSICKDLHASATKLRCKYRCGSATKCAVTYFSVYSRTPTFVANSLCCFRIVQDWKPGVQYRPSGRVKSEDIGGLCCVKNRNFVVK